MYHLLPPAYFPLPHLKLCVSIIVDGYSLPGLVWLGLAKLGSACLGPALSDLLLVWASLLFSTADLSLGSVPSQRGSGSTCSGLVTDRHLSHLYHLTLSLPPFWKFFPFVDLALALLHESLTNKYVFSSQLITSSLELTQV